MTKLRRLSVYGTASLMALGLAMTASSAFAQASDDTATVEEVLVTAQKRVENALSVPASVSVVSGQRLENLGAAQLIDFATYVPGFNVTNGGTPGQTNIQLRGITSNQDSATVGVYIDDSPLGSSGAYARANLFQIDLLPYDLERVEVLRGPQGTLYGASTLGGLLKYVFKNPSLDSLEARAGGELISIKGGGDIGYGARAMISAPLVQDQLGVRLSLFKQVTPGFIDNTAGLSDENEVRQTGGRLSVLWQASDALSVKLAAMLQEIETDGLSAVDIVAGTNTPVYGDLKRRHSLPEPFWQRTEFYSGTVNWDLGFAGFTSATSLSKTHTKQFSDISFAFGAALPSLGFPVGSLAGFPLDLQVEKFTQEFRLTSESREGAGDLEWMIGAFYTKEDTTNRQLGLVYNPAFANIGLFQNAFIPSTFEEKSVFGNLTYHFTEQFDVSAGVRWAGNDQTIKQIVSGLIAPPINLSTGSSEDVVTWSLSTRYRFDRDTMVYARAASGYRPGGANFTLPGFAIPATFEPDTLVNYEIGVKSDFADRRGTIEVTAFHIDWEKIKVTQIIGGFGTIANGKTAKSEGIEFSATFSPIAGLRLGANGAYTNAKLTENATATLGGLATAGARLGYIPRWTGALTADYEFPVFGDWTGRIGAGFRYIDPRPYQFSSTTPIVNPPARLEFANYTVFDLNAGVSNDRWTLRAYAKNLLDERAYLNNTGLGLYHTIIPPRTIGVSLDARF